MGTLSAVKNRQSAICGEVRTMPINSVPTGWLSCDGSAISRTNYSKLFGIIGTTFGSGDGSTTFNLPNYNSGKFLRGSGGLAAAIGTAQANATKKNGLTASAIASSADINKNLWNTNQTAHAHSTNFGSYSNVQIGSGTAVIDNAGTTAYTRSGGATANSASWASATASGTAAAQSITVNAGDAETRPDNYAVVFVIKY